MRKDGSQVNPKAYTWQCGRRRPRFLPSAPNLQSRARNESGDRTAGIPPGHARSARFPAAERATCPKCVPCPCRVEPGVTCRRARSDASMVPAATREPQARSLFLHSPRLTRCQPGTGQPSPAGMSAGRLSYRAMLAPSPSTQCTPDSPRALREKRLKLEIAGASRDADPAESPPDHSPKGGPRDRGGRDAPRFLRLPLAAPAPAARRLALTRPARAAAVAARST